VSAGTPVPCGTLWLRWFLRYGYAHSGLSRRAWPSIAIGTSSSVVLHASAYGSNPIAAYINVANGLGLQIITMCSDTTQI